MTRKDCKVIKLTKDQIEEIKNIYNLLSSSDHESKFLSLGLFKSLFPENAYFYYSDNDLNELVSVNEINLRYIHTYVWPGPILIGDARFSSILFNLLTKSIYFVSKNNG